MVSLIFEPKALLQMCFDICLVLLFFKPLMKETVLSRAIIGTICLLLTAPLYFSTGLTYFLRVLIRFLVYLIALNAAGIKDLRRTTYFAALVTVLFTACQNIFFSPKLFEIYRGTMHFSGKRLPDLIFCILIQWAVYIAAFYYIHKLLKLDKIDRFEPVEWMVLGFAILCEFYIKQALPAVNSTEGEHIEITVFSVILNVVVIAFLGSFVRYVHEKKALEEVRLQEAINEAYFRNLQLQKERDEEVRRLHHDMKNHLLAIEKLAGEGSERMGEYIGSLAEQLDPYESLVETGNELLNGILAEKQALARSKGIDLEIQADCSSLGFMSDTDLCTIFGNALDNAIEACEKVERQEDRSIRVKTEALAGQIIIAFTNTYLGSITMSNGLPETSKSDKKMHGIGLRSIRRTLEKYNGTLRLKPDADRFTLTVVIPLQ